MTNPPTPNTSVTEQYGADDDLVQRCREILEWGSTGLLAGGSGGALRALADRLRLQVGDHYAMSVAESQTKDEAMRALDAALSREAVLKARIAELEAALLPFAERADALSASVRLGTMVHFRLRHCRAARAALTPDRKAQT